MNEHDIHDQWADRTGAYSPDYYAYYGSDETSDLIRTTIDRFVDHDAAILELGCSSGRHLDHLREHGYEDLYGVDLNEDAFDVMEREYPELADAGTFYCAPIEEIVGEADDDRFDVVYSVETLQHLHPDAAWVFDDLTRMTTTLLVTAETDAIGVDAEDSTTADRDETAAAETGDPALRETREVDEMPLYVRDWSQAFGDRGWIELEDDAKAFDYHTFRAFRSPEA